MCAQRLCNEKKQTLLQKQLNAVIFFFFSDQESVLEESGTHAVQFKDRSLCAQEG